MNNLVPNNTTRALTGIAPLHQCRQIVLDTETTGLGSSSNRIIEIGCIELIKGERSAVSRHWYLNPEQAISEVATTIHGINNKFVADKPTFAEIADNLLGFIRGAELIIHNAPFDVSFLNAELARLGHGERIETMCGVVDTLAMARRIHPGQKNDLDALCQRYGVDSSRRQFHGALLDAELLTEVYQAMRCGMTKNSGM